MTKHFVILYSGVTDTEVRQMLDYLGAAGWWKWVSGSILVSTGQDDMTAAQLRDKFTSIANRPETRVLCLEVATRGWAGKLLPDSFKWLSSQWKQE